MLIGNDVRVRHEYRGMVIHERVKLHPASGVRWEVPGYGHGLPDRAAAERRVDEILAGTWGRNPYRGLSPEGHETEQQDRAAVRAILRVGPVRAGKSQWDTVVLTAFYRPNPDPDLEAIGAPASATTRVRMSVWKAMLDAGEVAADTDTIGLALYRPGPRQPGESPPPAVRRKRR